jgi:hypothetical protein
MRLAAALVLSLAAAAGARAGDPPAPDADSIAAAKKDFAAIKSAAAPDGAASLPTLDMKDIGPAPGAPAPAAPTPLPTEKSNSLDPNKKTGTGNWLVDAMDKDADRSRTSKPGDDLLKDDSDLTEDADRAGERGSKGTQSSADARDASDSKKEPAEHVYNPLDSFMGSWISARDHDLLVPTAKGESAAEADLGRARVEAPAGGDVAASSSLVDLLLPAPDTASWVDSKVEANPYIAPIDSEAASAMRLFNAPESSGLSPFELPDSSRAAASSGPAAQPADSSRTYLPDFAQPADDDKYFKQMKRF